MNMHTDDDQGLIPQLLIILVFAAVGLIAIALGA